MWPWGHVAVGYLLWSASVRGVDGRRPTGAEVAALAVGTQFPDLVDKPGAWVFGVLPSGRSLAHSLITATVVIAVVYVLARRRRREWLAAAFGVGYVSHSLADTVSSLLSGEFDKLTYLLWPVTPVPVYGPESGDSSATLGLFLLQLALTVAAYALWRHDGSPGSAGVVGRLRAVAR